MADAFVNNVVWVHQEKLHFCGPAVAQMVLTVLGVASPATPPSWQTQLYDYVTANTNAKRPKNAPDTEESPAFPEQKCERCRTSDPYTCWSSTPNVLKKLLNAKLGANRYTVSARANEESATDALFDSIDQGLPGIALIRGWAHWVVVDGYQHGLAGSENFLGRDVNGVYIRDPDATDSVHLIPWPKWRDEYLSVVPCGQYEGKIVVLKNA